MKEPVIPHPQLDGGGGGVSVTSMAFTWVCSGPQKNVKEILSFLSRVDH